MKILFISLGFLLALAPNITLAADYYDRQWYYSSIKFQTLTNQYHVKRGEGIVVAVIDEGVWISHPNLNGRNWTNSKEIPNNGIDDDFNGFIDDYYGWNFIDNDSNLMVKGSHGTAVAGIIAATENSQGMRGFASESKIMPLIACDSFGCSANNVTKAIRYAADNGASVINLSLGSTNGYVGFNTAYNEAIAYAYNKGVTIVASAGNGDIESGGQVGLNLDMFKVSPACNMPNGNKMVLVVGATAVDWSNYGSVVDVYAPGENILSLTVPSLSGGYGYKADWAGTSFSAPIVSGLIAVLKSTFPKLTNADFLTIFAKSPKILDAALVYDNAFDTFAKKGNLIIPPTPIIVTPAPIVIEPIVEKPKPVIQKKYVTVNRNINIRQQANEKSKVISIAKKGVKYEIVDDANKNWVKIKFNKTFFGWLKKSLTQKVK